MGVEKNGPMGGNLLLAIPKEPSKIIGLGRGMDREFCGKHIVARDCPVEISRDARTGRWISLHLCFWELATGQTQQAF